MVTAHLTVPTESTGIAVLKALRQDVCAYINSESMCDCKYVASGNRFHGEHTGCCEIRDMMNFLELMKHRK